MSTLSVYRTMSNSTSSAPVWRMCARRLAPCWLWYIRSLSTRMIRSCSHAGGRFCSVCCAARNRSSSKDWSARSRRSFARLSTDSFSSDCTLSRSRVLADGDRDREGVAPADGTSSRDDASDGACDGVVTWLWPMSSAEGGSGTMRARRSFTSSTSHLKNGRFSGRAEMRSCSVHSAISAVRDCAVDSRAESMHASSAVKPSSCANCSSGTCSHSTSRPTICNSSTPVSGGGGAGGSWSLSGLCTSLAGLLIERASSGRGLDVLTSSEARKKPLRRVGLGTTTIGSSGSGPAAAVLASSLIHGRSRVTPSRVACVRSICTTSRRCWPCSGTLRLR
eukprot:Unigene12671_Nuclearia_a/m.38467 Unigene12671_Nuclearia_a/g.38467  ORF Unigene12671_Nuclearia_a/g.38467 Unigene12671_Nuclearia_a/m.38467 type:complete len:335 (-) Unigene12671_Nuclearia_a:1015-2019(-)